MYSEFPKPQKPHISPFKKWHAIGFITSLLQILILKWIITKIKTFFKQSKNWSKLPPWKWIFEAENSVTVLCMERNTHWNKIIWIFKCHVFLIRYLLRMKQKVKENFFFNLIHIYCILLRNFSFFRESTMHYICWIIRRTKKRCKKLFANFRAIIFSFFARRR